MSAKPPETGSKPGPIVAEERERRRAEALRANLRRRKDQARNRAEDEAGNRPSGQSPPGSNPSDPA